jgi:hypothetical protein
LTVSTGLAVAIIAHVSVDNSTDEVWFSYAEMTERCWKYLNHNCESEYYRICNIHECLEFPGKNSLILVRMTAFD